MVSQYTRYSRPAAKDGNGNDVGDGDNSGDADGDDDGDDDSDAGDDTIVDPSPSCCSRAPPLLLLSLSLSAIFGPPSFVSLATAIT